MKKRELYQLEISKYCVSVFKGELGRIGVVLADGYPRFGGRIPQYILKECKEALAKNLNKKLAEVLDKGQFREFSYYTDAELLEDFDYSHMVKTDGNIFCLQTHEGWFECPVELVDYNLLWTKLGDIPVNDDEEIEEPFEFFEIGVNKYNIWHWFENTFNFSIAEKYF